MRDDASLPPAPGEEARCWDCAAPLAQEQRYCLACGAGVADVLRAVAPSAQPPAASSAPAGRTRRRPSGAIRAALAGFAGAFAVGLLAGAVARPASIGPPPGRRVVVVPTPAQNAAASAPEPADLGALQSQHLASSPGAGGSDASSRIVRV